jgi:hypothetical protein
MTPDSVVPYDSPTATENRSAKRAAVSGGMISPPETAARSSGSAGTSRAVLSSS